MQIVTIPEDQTSSFSARIAEIHENSYSQGHFTATFGREKLAEYNLRLIENSDITLVATEGDQLLGFVIAGETVSQGVSRFIAENRAFLIQKLLVHPDFLLQKVADKLRSVFKKESASDVRFRLLSIATAPSRQSSGVGAALLRTLEQHLIQRGVEEYGLSVLSKNKRAVAFYLRMGFTLEKEVAGSSYFKKKTNPLNASTLQT